jgi:hypothetical protein
MKGLRYQSLPLFRMADSTLAYMRINQYLIRIHLTSILLYQFLITLNMNIIKIINW